MTTIPLPEFGPGLIGGLSLQGDRDEQQDSFLLLRGRKTIFLMVADGMGGHSGGSLAAAIVKQTAGDVLRRHSADPPELLFPGIFQQSWENMRKAEAESKLDIRSTVVMIRLGSRGRADWAHLGDSRLYLFNPNGTLRQRTWDHTAVELAVREGEMSEEEARRHPNRSVLYASLGGEKPPKPVLGQADPPLEDGTLILLCSDGFWEATSIDEMRLLQARGQNLRKSLKQLARQAVQKGNGNADNTTAVAFIYRRDLFID